MSGVPVQVVVAAFQDEKGASDALSMLEELKRERLIGIQDAAVLRKGEDGKLHIKETADMGGVKGAALGGVAGGVIGAIAGAALAGPALVGALVGGLAAKLRDSGFNNDRLKTVGDGLPNGSSAVIAVVEHKWVDEVRRELAEAGADAMAEALSADLAGQLEAGHDVAFTALATQNGVVVAGQAGDEEAVAGGAAVLARDEVAGVEYVATEEGVVVRVLEATKDGVVEGIAAAAAEKGEEDDEGAEGKS
ncbi:MAG: DUF1269 domain-containing protein [Acidimicrobiia bacterium]|nr:DUF1269 domain-containing protein [Acidimicrobiia bacterium]